MSQRGNRGRGRGRGGRGGRGGHNDQNHQAAAPNDPDRAQATNNTVQLLKDFLSRRYDASSKLLNLSSIGSDEQIRASGMFKQESTQMKFFPALMVICNQLLPSREEKENAIHSVTLSGNNLPTIKVIMDLVYTLPHIRNLDLSGNAFDNVGVLKPWKGRFRVLEHLIVDPFAQPGWEEELTAWFPKLKVLNGIQVRPVEMAMDAPLVEGVQDPGAQGTLAPTPTPALALSAEQKEEMVLYVQQATNLTRDYAVQCLEAGGWDLNRAGELFTQSRGTLPAEAFI